MYYCSSYYFSLLRFHISNQLHLRNRKIFNKSWDRVLKNRRLLRVSEAKLLNQR